MVALAAAVWVGALVARPVAVVFVVAGLAGAAVVRRPVVVCAAAAILASCMAARAWEGMEPGPTGRFEGTVTLLTDPAPEQAAVRAGVRAGDRHLDAWFRGGAAGAVRHALAGERLTVRGTVTPVTGDRVLAARHVVGRLSVDDVTDVARAAGPFGLANRLRRALAEGLGSLPADRRSLALGIAVGDDRDQSPEIMADFDAAGLRHLLAVSGQNVAFVLVAARPLLARCSLHARFVATLAVLLAFALVTRFEPSVMRATAMAVVAATSTAAGRPGTALEYLAAAVAGLVLIDPFLVHAVGFQLSVAASLAILLLAGPLAERSPGPRVLVEPLAVTVAAQLGVAPLLVAVFGGVPVAGIPANLAAAPAVAPLMVSAIGGGLALGALGPATRGWAHTIALWPTDALAGWLLWVAHTAAAADLGELDGTGVAIATLAILCLGAMCRIGRPIRER
jgi:competence protein ComEC